MTGTNTVWIVFAKPVMMLLTAVLAVLFDGRAVRKTWPRYRANTGLIRVSIKLSEAEYGQDSELYYVVRFFAPTWHIFTLIYLCNKKVYKSLCLQN